MKSIASHALAAGAAGVWTVSVSPSKPETWDVIDAIREEGKLSRKGIPGAGLSAPELERFILSDAVKFHMEQASSATPTSAGKGKIILPPGKDRTDEINRALKKLKFSLRRNTRGELLEYLIAKGCPDPNLATQRHRRGLYRQLGQVTLQKLKKALADNVSIRRGSAEDVKVTSIVPTRGKHGDLLSDDWFKTQLQYVGNLKENHYDPFLKTVTELVSDHVSGKKPWDEETRLDGAYLKRLFGLEPDRLIASPNGLEPNDSALTDSWFRCLIGAMIKRACFPGSPWPYVFLLMGDSGAGKSAFWSQLLPGYHSAGLSVNEPREEKLIEKMLGTVIAEISELSHAKRDEGRIKEFLTAGTDKYRRPYDVLPEVIERTCVFVSGTNEREIFFRSDGNRRFLILEVTIHSLFDNPRSRALMAKDGINTVGDYIEETLNRDRDAILLEGAIRSEDFRKWLRDSDDAAHVSSRTPSIPGTPKLNPPCRLGRYKPEC